MNMLFFTEKVVNLKAWQLYLGNAFWTLFVGLILLILAKVLGIFGLDSNAITNILHRAGQISHARSPNVLSELAQDVVNVPDQIISGSPTPTHYTYSESSQIPIHHHN